MAQVFAPFHLINTMGHFPVGNISLVGSVIQDHRIMLVGIIHPYLQLLSSHGSARRVTGVAQIDHIWCFLREPRDKPVFPGTGQVNHL